MESEVCWCDLPAELLAIIAGQTPSDIIRFRSVCQSWRFSLPPPLPNKHILSPLFPLTISFDDRIPTPVTANAVYLVRHHHDDSKVWMLSAQEYNPGKFLLQHPLTYQTIPGSSGNVVLDLSEWKVTQIHTSYTYKDDTLDDLCAKIQRNVVLVPNSTTPTALCRYRPPRNSLWAFRTDEEGGDIYASQLSPFFSHEIDDFVSFNGWIYLTDAQGRNEDDSVDSYDMLMFDYKTSQQFGIVCDNLGSYLTMVRPLTVRFVVSDGDLYIVSEAVYGYALECWVYRLVRDGMNVPTCCKWERVEDLGDRVFFISKNCSFSVSARDLPRPWKGNSVVHTFHDFDSFIRVFDLDTKQWKLWDRLLSEGYLDLFYPPCSSWTQSKQPRKFEVEVGLAKRTNLGDPAKGSDKGKGVVDNTIPKKLEIQSAVGHSSTASDGINIDQEEGSTSSTSFISSSQKVEEELKN